MEKSWYKIFNYSTIGIAVIVALLLVLNKIPKDYYTPILIGMIVIFVLRIIIRLYLIKTSKKLSS